jgi:hypothetical protein
MTLKEFVQRISAEVTQLQAQFAAEAKPGESVVAITVLASLNRAVFALDQLLNSNTKDKNNEYSLASLIPELISLLYDLNKVEGNIEQLPEQIRDSKFIKFGQLVFEEIYKCGALTGMKLDGDPITNSTAIDRLFLDKSLRVILQKCIVYFDIFQHEVDNTLFNLLFNLPFINIRSCIENVQLYFVKAYGKILRQHILQSYAQHHIESSASFYALTFYALTFRTRKDAESLLRAHTLYIRELHARIQSVEGVASYCRDLGTNDQLPGSEAIARLQLDYQWLQTNMSAYLAIISRAPLVMLAHDEDTGMIFILDIRHNIDDYLKLYALYVAGIQKSQALHIPIALSKETDLACLQLKTRLDKYTLLDMFLKKPYDKEKDPFTLWVKSVNNQYDRFKQKIYKIKLDLESDLEKYTKKTLVNNMSQKGKSKAGLFRAADAMSDTQRSVICASTQLSIVNRLLELIIDQLAMMYSTSNLSPISIVETYDSAIEKWQDVVKELKMNYIEKCLALNGIDPKDPFLPLLDKLIIGNKDQKKYCLLSFHAYLERNKIFLSLIKDNASNPATELCPPAAPSTELRPPAAAPTDLRPPSGPNPTKGP